MIQTKGALNQLGACLTVESLCARYAIISDLMNFQDQIDSLQKLIFAHLHGSKSSEIRISALNPQVKELFGVYRFVKSMLQAMHQRETSLPVLV